jgi:hypothetical protein
VVVANEWKDSNDKVMPVKQWLEERRFMQVRLVGFIYAFLLLMYIACLDAGICLFLVKLNVFACWLFYRNHMWQPVITFFFLVSAG